MIYSQIGKKFINHLNEVEGTEYTPKSFFIDVYLPLFFGEEKSLIMISNSPPFQETIVERGKARKANKKYVFNVDNIINNFTKKIERGDIDGSTMPDGGAKEMTATTSFNFSLGINHNPTEDTIYCSWIGYSLAVQLNGGISFVFNDLDILYLIYQGWTRYRELISNPIYDHVNANQILSWNGHWLMNNCESFPEKISKFNPLKEKSLKAVSWVELVFKLARKYPNQTINTFACKFGQTNETYGFIPIRLSKLSTFLSFCKEYFGDNEFMNQPQMYKNLFGTAYSFRKVCELGSIGMLSIKPELLRLEELHHKSDTIKKKINSLTKEYSKDDITINLYKLYIMATLGSKEIQEDSKKFANFLVDFKESKYSKSEGRKLVDDFFECTTLESVLNIFTEMADENLSTESQRETLTELLEIAMNHEKKLKTLMAFIKFTYRTCNSAK